MSTLTPTITATMAWEFWSLARIRIVAGLLGIGCLNALYYHLATLFSESLPEEAQINLFLATFFTNITLIVFILLRSRDADARSGMALDTRAFLLPLPTWQLVLSKMFFPAAAAGLLWIAVSTLTLAVTSSGATGENWPLLGPALAAAMLTAWGLAIYWLPMRPRPLKWLVATALLLGPIAWTVLRFGGLTSGPPSLWSAVTVQEGAALAAFLLAAYAVAVFGTVQARRGVTLGFSHLDDVADGLSRRLPRTVSGTFRSPATAQLWFEWHQKGWMIPLYAACGLLTMAIMAGYAGGTAAILPALSKIVVFFLFAAPPMTGCLMGRFSQSSRESAIDIFRAARPLSDTTFANAILKVGALSLVATWAATALTFAAILGVLDLLGEGGQLAAAWQMLRGRAEATGWTGIAVSLAGLLIVSWTNMALVTSAFLTGRNKVVAALVFVPYGVGVTAFIGFKMLGSEAISILFIAGSWLFSSAALALTIVAFAAARKRRLIGRQLPVVALAFGLAVGLGFAWAKADQVASIIRTGVALERSVLVLGPGLLALAIAPLALAPLALTWNRHR